VSALTGQILVAMVDGAPVIVLTSGRSVDALPYRVDIERHCVEMLMIEGRSD